MIGQNESEEIIRLIYNGFDLKLISFELDIPIQELQEYKNRLEMRRTVKKFIKNGKIDLAIEKLNSFIESTDNNLIERYMLLKLNAYANNTKVSEEDLQQIEEERKMIGFSRNIDKILEELKVQIPKRKECKIKKVVCTEEQSISTEEQENEPNYDEVIQRYKEEIAINPQKEQTIRNLLAFAYFKAGRMDEARDELNALIDEYSNYIAYRQLVHLEKVEGNLDDAKIWAYDAIEKFPYDIRIREQLISIAREEKDNQEIIRQLKEISKVEPENQKNKKRLQRIIKDEER